ncbi:MAG: c-type cytochrome, partial [Chloroflexi bacterium]|nr:c-type cytochrome [Chloroflexota bacterium]
MRKTIILLLVMSVLALALAACGGSDSPSTSESMKAGDAAKGAALFSKTCQACHGEGGVGVEGFGKSLTTSEFVAGLSDAEFMAFVKHGRPSGDPLNTTGLDMPPKGG